MLDSNPMSASSKNVGIFCKFKVNFNVKYDFATNDARKKCNTSFRVILVERSISDIILTIILIYLFLYSG